MVYHIKKDNLKIGLLRHYGEKTLRKSAFTLAEVLITLGIIGVVAAMTLPSVIAKKQTQELQSGLKSGYSLLQQGLLRMSLDKGYTVRTENGNYTEGRFVDSFKKYFEKIYDCDKEVNKPNPAICMGRNDGSGPVVETAYLNFSKKTHIGSNLLDDGQFVTANGMLILVEQYSGAGLLLSIDVNGKKKKPNIWGRDLFTFQLMDDGKLLPMGMEGTRYFQEDYCSNNSTVATNGIGCTYRALTDKSFWDDYH